MKLVKRKAEPMAAGSQVVLHVADSTEPLHTKLRPKTLGDVIGQDAVVASIDALFKSNRIPHLFIFGGPSGCGKTTLARIVASMIGCGEVVDYDAGRFSTIDSLRELIDAMQFQSLAASAKKLVIIDEAHAIASKNGFNALLKITEEPPEHLFVAFCTTEPERLPKTLHTRAHAYVLNAVPWDTIASYLEWVIETERLSVLAEYIDVIARRAEGSVRQALQYVSMMQGITDPEQRDALLLTVDAESSTEVIELARMLCDRRGKATWAKAAELLNGLSKMNAESVRITMMSYAAAVALKSTGDDAARALAVMQAFSVTCNPVERFSPIVLACGGLLLGE